MRLRREVKEPSAHFHEGADHVDVVVRKVEEKLLQAEKTFGLGKQMKLDQLADEATDFQLRFDFHLKKDFKEHFAELNL